MSHRNKPLKTKRLNNVTASIWNNQAHDGSFFTSVTFTRTYSDQAGGWHQTSSFHPADLYLLRELNNWAIAMYETSSV